MFLEFWKRRQAEIAYEWDLLGYEDEEVSRDYMKYNEQTTMLGQKIGLIQPFHQELLCTYPPPMHDQR